MRVFLATETRVYFGEGKSLKSRGEACFPGDILTDKRLLVYDGDDGGVIFVFFVNLQEG